MSYNLNKNCMEFYFFVSAEAQRHDIYSCLNKSRTEQVPKNNDIRKITWTAYIAWRHDTSSNNFQLYKHPLLMT